MIAVIGGNYITLKRLALASGMVTYDRARASSYNGVLNTSLVPSRVPAIPSSVPVLNKSLVTNKMNALRMVSNAGLGDNVPEYRYDTPVHWEHGWIVKPYASQAGRGVRRYARGTIIPEGCYLQRDIFKYREFRAHVALWLNNPVFTIQEKKPKTELWEQFMPSSMSYEWPLNNQEDRALLPVTWNIESGFYFRRNTDPDNRREKVSRFPLLARIEELAEKTVKALKYQYGAVDILMNDDRELFVVEVNSHPAIKNENSIEIYKKVLHDLSTFNRDSVERLMTPMTMPSQVSSNTFVRGQGVL